MDVYGLTGGIGAGKTAVAELLQEYGVPVVSADELSRMVVAKGSEGLAQVVEAFGDALLDPNGELDRRAMARLVFADAEKRRRLESILHPLIRERYETVLDAIEKSGHVHAVYEVPLLFEKNLQGDMKAVILVTASDSTRVKRVRVRDGISEHDVRARMAAQMDEDEKRKRADYVLYNEGSLDDLRREVEQLLSRFMKIPPRRPAHYDSDGIPPSVMDDHSQGPMPEALTPPVSKRAPEPATAPPAPATAGATATVTPPPPAAPPPAVAPAVPPKATAGAPAEAPPPPLPPKVPAPPKAAAQASTPPNVPPPPPTAPAPGPSATPKRTLMPGGAVPPPPPTDKPKG